MVVRYGPSPGPCIEWKIGPDKIPTDDQAAHIGVVRDSSTGGSAATCLNNLSKANKAFFAKFRQIKDTTPQAALAIYQSSILPILTYGLEVVIHVPKYISLLQDAQDYFLKQIAGLPTSGVAAYTTAAYCSLHHCSLPHWLITCRGNCSQTHTRSPGKRHCSVGFRRNPNYHPSVTPCTNDQ